MRTMAVDWGEARIGVAVTDETGAVPMPRPALAEKDKGAQIRRVAALIAELEVGRVVVGVPYRMTDGEPGEMAERARKFASKLDAHVDAEVVCLDERLTTREAERTLEATGARRRGKDRGRVDSVAATLLLQSYLDLPTAE